MTEEYKVDKTNFGAGKWQEEPDYLSWVDEETGLSCEIKRMESMGHLCGYVTVPGLSTIDDNDYCDSLNIDIHGGITLSRKKDGGHTFGFDCAHGKDYIPMFSSQEFSIYTSLYTSFRDETYNTYKDIEYVKEECTSLAKQLKEIFLARK